jgi:ethylbenzene dioxygenase beta subunit
MSPLSVPAESLVKVQAFLAHEARLLDEECYAEWLALFTEDAHYWVPGIENRGRADAEGTHGPTRMAYFDDTLDDLRLRITRFTSSTAWAEDPPTRHLHVISNVEAEPAATPGELLVRSVFVNYRGQGDLDAATLYGRREDILRDTPEGLRIAGRTVLLRHNVLPAKNINTFF